MRLNRTVIVPLVTAAASIVSVTASAETCSAITTVPVTINAAGSYCVTQNLRYEGVNPSALAIDPAITIASNDVTLDFKGFALVGGSNASVNKQSHGVYS